MYNESTRKAKGNEMDEFLADMDAETSVCLCDRFHYASCADRPDDAPTFESVED